MKNHPTAQPRSLPGRLAEAAAAYQSAVVIPHCPECARPCCKLETLVLDLEWRQVKILWKIDEARAAFDRRLASGQGPQEIRSAGGRYFIHRKPCPAYDEERRNCRIYGQDLKPVGCSDFPVYENEGTILADLRCEAVKLQSLIASLGRALGPEFRIVQSANDEFPFLVTLSVRRAPGRGTKRNR